jgi:DNA-binding NtrC family response regulator
MISVVQVDDDPIFNAVLSKHFAGQDGVNLLQLTTIDQLEKHISNGQPMDVLILDLSLPDRDAIEFLASFDSAGFNGKIIVITSQPRSVIDMAVTLAKAAGAEINLTLEKPLTPEKLTRVDAIVYSLS